MTDTTANILNITNDMRIYEASPNTGTTLAGSANVVSRYKKLRKKEDDMHNTHTPRQIKPVPVSSKEAAINKHDRHQTEAKKDNEKHVDVTTPEFEDEAYEPFVGVLVDYTA